MRKTILIMASAAALALPVIGLVPNAGAVAATPTCTTAKGTATFKPPLPTTSAKVTSTIAANGTETKCTGGGVTSAKLTASFKFKMPGNCASLLGGTGGKLTGPATLTWNNNKTSKATTVTLSQPVKGSPTIAQISGKITTGLFVGKTLTQRVTFAPVAGGGDCVSKPLSKVNYSQKTALTIK